MLRRTAHTPTTVLLALVAIAAAIALGWPRRAAKIDPAAIQATIDQLREIADAADRQERTTGRWPANRAHGATPLGGTAVWKRTETLAAVTIENATSDRLAAWHTIDQQLDDGDLSGGWVWWRDGRFVWVLEEE